jgi:hypothetical protein
LADAFPGRKKVMPLNRLFHSGAPPPTDVRLGARIAPVCHTLGVVAIRKFCPDIGRLPTPQIYRSVQQIGDVSAPNILKSFGPQLGGRH